MAHATPSLENYAVFGFFQNNLFTTPAHLGGYFFMVEPRKESKGRHQYAHWCTQVSGGHLGSPWEIPFLLERSPQGLWDKRKHTSLPDWDDSF